MYFSCDGEKRRRAGGRLGRLLRFCSSHGFIISTLRLIFIIYKITINKINEVCKEL
jgi:hypothetical protein